MFDIFKQKVLKYIGYPLVQLHWRIFSPEKPGARALVFFQDHILLTKNLNHDYWTMPGGGVKKNETPENCVIRELKEELHLGDLTVESKLGEYKSSKKGKKDVIHIFVLRARSLEFERHWELADAKWFRLTDLPENLSPATRRRIKEYTEGDRDIVSIW